MALLAATEEVVTTMPEALVNTALGMGTVFLVLILISFVIYLLKFLPALLGGRSQKKEAQPEPAAPAQRTAPVTQAAPVPAVKKPENDFQLVAVITAAVHAAMEEEGTPVPADGLVIRSIRKRY